MKNVTLAIDEDLLQRARALAEKRHTTLNAMVRSMLAHELDQEDRIAWAREGLRRLMDKSRLDMGPDYKWNREEIYAEREDRLLPGHERSRVRSAGKDKR
jgi:hypothetical protein